MKEFELIELANGLRALYKNNKHSKISHVGIMLDIGSRDELHDEQGLAHFWEHMAFKGTKKRKAHHIIERLEALGGELNAYTTKEKICFYASVLDEHTEKAIELLSDITFHSTFPEKQIEREKTVILEEMSMYRDTPEDSIQDELDSLVYGDHAMGYNILGTENTVSSFRQSHFFDFLTRNLNTTRIAISYVGPIDFSKYQRMIEKFLGEIQYKNHTAARIPPPKVKNEKVEMEKPISQCHIAYGVNSYSIQDPQRLPFYLLINMLGGPAMNSRLNMSLRERNGLVYGVDMGFQSHSDSGLLSLHLATDSKNVKKVESLITKEFDLFKNKPLSNIQLSKAKLQIKGQLAMSEENNNAMMLAMAKSLLDLDRLPTLNEIFQKIDGVTAEELHILAIENLNLDKMSQLIYVPTKS